MQIGCATAWVGLAVLAVRVMPLVIDKLSPTSGAVVATAFTFTLLGIGTMLYRRGA